MVEGGPTREQSGSAVFVHIVVKSPKPMASVGRGTGVVFECEVAVTPATARGQTMPVVRLSGEVAANRAERRRVKAKVKERVNARGGDGNSGAGTTHEFSVGRGDGGCFEERPWQPRSDKEV